jgi:hypothetical protein
MMCISRVLTITGIMIGLMMPAKMAFADPDGLPPGQLPTFTAL